MDESVLARRINRIKIIAADIGRMGLEASQLVTSLESMGDDEALKEKINCFARGLKGNLESIDAFTDLLHEWARMMDYQQGVRTGTYREGDII